MCESAYQQLKKVLINHFIIERIPSGASQKGENGGLLRLAFLLIPILQKDTEIYDTNGAIYRMLLVLNDCLNWYPNGLT